MFRLIFAVVLANIGASTPPTSFQKIPSIIAPASEQALLPSLQRDIESGKKRIESFFRHRFEKPFTIEVFADRKSFDACLKSQFAIPEPQRWMVAAGVSDRLVLLSPRVWKTEAVDHDGANSQHVRDLIVHELVHVYHGQHNPSHYFDDMDDLGWFVEGLAVLVSGQLEHSHAEDAKWAITEGKAPDKLVDAWSGRYRYGVCGSMVKYVEKRFGRKMVWQLMGVMKPDEAFKLLKVTESEFLEGWKRFIIR